jgi:hypothetical protein
MASNPPRDVYEYREAESLDEVNRLSQEEGFDLLQALSTPQGLRYIVRRQQQPSEVRRAGFSIPPRG